MTAHIFQPTAQIPNAEWFELISILAETLSRSGRCRPALEAALIRVVGRPPFETLAPAQLKTALLWGAIDDYFLRRPADRSDPADFFARREEMVRVAAGRNRPRSVERKEVPPGPTLYVASGVPGGGKSTWIARALPEVAVVSSDDLRRALTGDPTDQSRNTEVFRLAHQRIGILLARGESVCFDATNLLRRHRTPVWRIARRHTARCVAVVFDTPLQVALDRNRTRDRRVPDEVILRFFASWERPTPHEAHERRIVSGWPAVSHI